MRHPHYYVVDTRWIAGKGLYSGPRIQGCLIIFLQYVTVFSRLMFHLGRGVTLNTLSAGGATLLSNSDECLNPK
jgi:hypothetical protein